MEATCHKILKSTQLPEMNSAKQIDDYTTFQFPCTNDKPQTSRRLQYLMPVILRGFVIIKKGESAVYD